MEYFLISFMRSIRGRKCPVLNECTGPFVSNEESPKQESQSSLFCGRERADWFENEN